MDGFLYLKSWGNTPQSTVSNSFNYLTHSIHEHCTCPSDRHKFIYTFSGSVIPDTFAPSQRKEIWLRHRLKKLEVVPQCVVSIVDMSVLPILLLGSSPLSFIQMTLVEAASQSTPPVPEELRI